jgi:hypothetical protein
MNIELSNKEVKDLLAMLEDESHLSDLWPIVKVLERKLKNLPPIPVTNKGNKKSPPLASKLKLESYNDKKLKESSKLSKKDILTWSSNSGEGFKCYICNKYIPSIEEMKKHMRNHLKENKKPKESFKDRTLKYKR